MHRLLARRRNRDTSRNMVDVAGTRITRQTIAGA